MCPYTLLYFASIQREMVSHRHERKIKSGFIRQKNPLPDGATHDSLDLRTKSLWDDSQSLYRLVPPPQKSRALLTSREKEMKNK